MTKTRGRRARRIAALAAAVLLLLFFVDALGCRRLSGSDFPPATPQARALRTHVETLASEAWGGRVPGTAGNEAAAAYLEKALRDAGYTPHPRLGSFRFSVGPGDNVVGYLAADAGVDADANGLDGSEPGDEAESSRAIVLGAHFDHL